MGVTREAFAPAAGMGGDNALHWLRLGLRVHDNPALKRAICSAREAQSSLFVLFIIDRSRFELPKDADVVTRMAAHRHKFLHESLEDLDGSLRSRGSRLFVVHGEPVSVLERVMSEWNIGLLTYERDVAPYSRERDRKVGELAGRMGVNVHSAHSKTLFDLDRALDLCGEPPLTYKGFLSLASKLGPVAGEEPMPEGKWPPPDDSLVSREDSEDWIDSNTFVDATELKFSGGETEALSRLDRVTSNKQWVAAFEKPQTSPNSLEPATTVLSPYLAMGCLSPRRFYHRIADIYRGRKHSEPPTSLHGQLLFREHFHLVGYATTNFGRMVGNPICKQIPWDSDDRLFEAWRTGQTGFPFIDAIMTQLIQEGWIHHLARHAVACFLTRGDLFQHWEKGAEVFERHLLDGDWSLNVANWLWLSCSAFFHQYFRVYSPIGFGKKTDTDGSYIRKYLPVLKNMPTKYIYEPWTAPRDVQQRAGCIIGKDYPKPIVDHAEASTACKDRMQRAYAAQESSSGGKGRKRGENGAADGGPTARRRRKTT